MVREALVLANIWDGSFLCMEKLKVSRERLGVRLRYFSKRFADHAAYYQLVILIRQTLLTIAAQYFHSFFLGVSCLVVLLISIIVHNRIQPYEYEFQIA